jgi:hypothetical protein
VVAAMTSNLHSKFNFSELISEQRDVKVKKEHISFENTEITK